MIDTILFSYIGPETILPVASAFAAIVGAIMFCGRSITQFAVKGYRLVWRRGEPTVAEASPEQDDFGV